MTLRELLDGVLVESKLVDIEIKTIARDSRMVEPGSLFFAIKGSESDGHNYLTQAIANGAVAVIVEKDMGLSNQIVVKDSHQAYGIACGNYYGNPAQSLKLIGVTGTNGKTTTTYIIKGILESLGKKVGVIGTIENIIGDISLQARHTTPDPFELHALFRRMVTAGCQYVVMEVSSHAMDQQRLAGCSFASAGFSNLTREHLDYHGTMENYYRAKKKLFDISSSAVINADDNYAQRLYSELEMKKIAFSLKDKTAEIYADNISFSQQGARFNIHYKTESYPVEFVQPGNFSVSNALMAAGVCLEAGVSFKEVAKGLANCPSIPGRFEVIPVKGSFTIIRDFAHSPDGLEQLLSTVREFVTGRIVTLFGCAGERDRSKRKDMSKIVAKYSDMCIMTSDNPRSEPIKQILEDALPGFEDYDTPYITFEDRFDAIVWMLEHSKQEDYLVLAGKGHEDYQVLDYGSINFNEKEIVQNLMKH